LKEILFSYEIKSRDHVYWLDSTIMDKYILAKQNKKHTHITL